MTGPAANWVKANCTNPKMARDLTGFLFRLERRRRELRFLIGGRLTRSLVQSGFGPQSFAEPSRACGPSVTSVTLSPGAKT
jgi:hypothetical protein